VNQVHVRKFLQNTTRSCYFTSLC